MNPPSAQLLVFVSGHLACVKIVGRANFSTSIDFKALINELEKQGFTCYILDLSECVLMDSTFLGVMAGLALKFRDPQNRNGQDSMIELLNPNARNLDSLEKPWRAAFVQGREQSGPFARRIDGSGLCADGNTKSRRSDA